MTQKTGRSFMPTLLIIVVVAGAFFLAPKMFSPNGHKSDDQQMLLLQVVWSPVQHQIRVDYAIGSGETKREDPEGGTWEKAVTVKRGTVVALFAYQSKPGTLMCAVKERNRLLAHDNNVGRGGTMANAVKCITGG